MQDHSQNLVFGAMMVAFFTILLAGAFYIPLIGVIILPFIPLPIILYRLRYNRISTIFVVFSGSLLTLLVGGLYIIPLAVLLGMLGFLIAESILIGKSKLYTFMASGIYLIAIGMLGYIIGVLFFNFNVVDLIFQAMNETKGQFLQSFEATGMEPKLYESIVESAFVYYQSAIPAMFILMVYVFTFLMVIPNFEVLRRLGHDVPKFSPFREMRLPLITIFIYGLFVVLPYMMDMRPESSAYLFYVNATIIIRTLLALQGFALILYIMHTLKLPKVVSFFSVLLAFLFNPITTLLGILDIGMNIRALIGKDNLK
ncbi:DUF2232 domain-containing protein [Sporosarcina saromensis]|uniref:DUF2232 domain-containing protein n=1 Tax=Sporosarcina saromensis TaxID=359365 RepID=A0ABU4GBL0_9BACL|nr:DUF2232 domain-containing protein [Sporosarcina saromensis]MDW0114333.1 DUF2232 domain-containing protein [Sporosarcina saromensis]